MGLVGNLKKVVCSFLRVADGIGFLAVDLLSRQGSIFRTRRSERRDIAG